MSSNLSESDQKDLAQARAISGPQPGTVWRHYKGGLYVIICRSIQEDTLEPLVTYQSNLKGTIWTRTLQNFTQMVLSIEGTGYYVPRFQREEG